MAKFREKIFQKAAGAFFRAKKTADEAYLSPGGLVNKGVETLIENPIASGGAVASLATDVLIPASVVIPKAAMAAAIGNRVISKKGKESLHRAAVSYGKSKFANSVSRIPNVPTMAQIAQGLGRGIGLG